MWAVLEAMQLLECCLLVGLAWLHRGRLPHALARSCSLMFVVILLFLRCSELLVELGAGVEAVRAIRNWSEAAATSSLVLAVYVSTRPPMDEALTAQAQREEERTEELASWVRAAREVESQYQHG